MKDAIITARNSTLGALYRTIAKPFLFRQDPEYVHDRVLSAGAFLGRGPLRRLALSALFDYSHPLLHQNILGIDFHNPVGLAAGFDKNAELVETLPEIGFGFAEIGSVTASPCAGNPKPRLWRLPASEALVVYYGLKNNGAAAVSDSLKQKKIRIPIGTSVAVTNSTHTCVLREAVKDCKIAFDAFSHCGAYTTVNISCPNALGGQPFIKPHTLDYLLDILDPIPSQKPVFIKMSPDISFAEADLLLGVLKNHRVHGIIVSNLTKRRENSAIADMHVPAIGGISGRPVKELSDKLLSHIYQREGTRFVLVGCGGIFTAEDAYRKIRLGASLVQMITGMIYKGPQVVSEINHGLVGLLARDGFSSIINAVGTLHA